MNLNDLIKDVESSGLSSVKGVVGRLLQIIGSQETSTHDLKELIQLDPPLLARVLRVANSPYFGAPCTISEIDHALIWIGFDALSEIVLTQKVVELFSGNDPTPDFSVRSLWRHSLAVAIMAKVIYRREFGEPGHDAYAAGLIHDIGLLIECQLRPREFGRIVRAIEDGNREIAEVETEVLGFDHGALGGAIAKIWNFPPTLVSAIENHHSPYLATENTARMVRTLFVSDHLAFNNSFGYGHPARPDRGVVLACARRLGLTDYGMQALGGVMVQEVGRLEEKGYL